MTMQTAAERRGCYDRFEVDDYEERKQFLRNRLPDSEYRGAFLDFARRLTFGYRQLVVPPPSKEKDLTKLLERGEFFHRPIEFIKGEASECHANTARLYEEGVLDYIVTGYALSDDGLWRQHSWGIGHDGQIIETTEPRENYYGFALRNDEAVEFCAFN